MIVSTEQSTEHWASWHYHAIPFTFSYLSDRFVAFFGQVWVVFVRADVTVHEVQMRLLFSVERHTKYTSEWIKLERFFLIWIIRLESFFVLGNSDDLFSLSAVKIVQSRLSFVIWFKCSCSLSFVAKVLPETKLMAIPCCSFAVYSRWLLGKLQRIRRPLNA